MEEEPLAYESVGRLTSNWRLITHNGFRVVAHDRRGHGRSSQPWQGNDMDTYADDLAAVIEALDLHGVTLLGHSTGGGEVIRYIWQTPNIACAHGQSLSARFHR